MCACKCIAAGQISHNGTHYKINYILYTYIYMYIQYVYMYYLAPFQKVAENGRDLLRVTLLHELDACHYKLSMFITVVKAMFPTYMYCE